MLDCHWQVDNKVIIVRYTSEYPGQEEPDLVSRWEAEKTQDLKILSPRTAAPAGASSPPQAAKTAMSSQKYPKATGRINTESNGPYLCARLACVKHAPKEHQKGSNTS